MDIGATAGAALPETAAGMIPPRETNLPTADGTTLSSVQFQSIGSVGIAQSPSIASSIDRFRAEFSFRNFRLSSPTANDAVVPRSLTTQRSVSNPLQDAMNSALSAQIALMKTTIGFHFGISGLQQGQSGVKSLLEKT